MPTASRTMTASWPWLFSLSLILGACANQPPARPLAKAGQQPMRIGVDDESGPLSAAQAAAAVYRIEAVGVTEK